MTVASLLSIKSDRLNRSLFQLAEIGKQPNGGVSRVAFTTEDLLARQLVQSWMVEAGMTVRIDAAGNIIGRYPGRYEDAPALATGSHIDTVPMGGRYDGCLGVLAGIEVAHTLNEAQEQLDHPIEVIVFTDEESTVLGSKAMAGQVRENPDYYSRKDGTSIQTCLQKIGGDWDKIKTARRDRKQIAAFVELHVEQGGVMEAANAEIGVVKGIVGQYRFKVSVTGRPNHAGTTPMHMRKDALVAASQIVLAVNRIAIETPGEQVGTVGYLKVLPCATNTVPAQVDLRIDLRDLSQDHLDELVAKLQQEFAEIALLTHTEITMEETFHVLPTLATPHIMNTIQSICDRQGIRYCYLPSRAGHDAQEVGRFTDMGMIFVPSRGGISHSEEEYTSAEQCAQGANVLLQTFLALDQHYPVRS
ncbi:MAG TPA: Zn-dependent hydrolase [Leptolyngbyaceae cyanobacterium M33_DOE_097]|uniref:Zn-dependent hydrolase n=1 Tax=Oscillatoriales cyanobacterium SpSt-418 TaxID=2282169 RepID=A0A7C3KD08_9CYAN|nr:Zn-dependent hydrolase [Leptolyngbyaceae cyanobacterium M33_DOE_097]